MTRQRLSVFRLFHFHIFQIYQEFFPKGRVYPFGLFSPEMNQQGLKLDQKWPNIAFLPFVECIVGGKHMADFGGTPIFMEKSAKQYLIQEFGEGVENMMMKVVMKNTIFCFSFYDNCEQHEVTQSQPVGGGVENLRNCMSHWWKLFAE